MTIPISFENDKRTSMKNNNVHEVKLTNGKPELTEEQYAILDHRGFDRVKVGNALKIMRGVMPRQDVRVSGLAPCTFCGSSDFVRSGTCHTCLNCSNTSGCS